MGQLNVMTQKGTLIKETYYLPKYLIRDYNEQLVWFNVSEEQLQNFTKEQMPMSESYEKYQKEGSNEAVIPVLEERVQITKNQVTEEVIITKEPIVEYRLIEVPIMREELKIVRKPFSLGDKAQHRTDLDDTDKEIHILLQREEVQITKKPYLFEEVIISKEKVTDAKKVGMTITKERVVTESQ